MEKFKFSNLTENLKIENEIFSGILYVTNRFKNICSFLYGNFIYNKISVKIKNHNHNFNYKNLLNFINYFYVFSLIMLRYLKIQIQI
jgi:hypothetical protein